VDVSGSVARQVLINLNPGKMSSQGVGVDEVVRAIQNANMDVPAGRIEQGPTEQLVRVEGKIKDPAGFNRIIVARRAKGPVYLSEVADVVDGEREADNLSRINGKPGISVNVLKVQDANIVEVGDGVKKAAAALNKELPSDVKLEIVYADVEWIEKALHGVKVTIVEGALLTIFIVFLFLHSWRSTIITGLTLPISVIATFTAVYMFGFTLNFITLMALSLCIGLLIDDAIVVRENIVRHIGMGKDHYRAAREGTDEIGLAVMATTFAIVAVFVPVAFMKGIIGRFFFQFGITVAVAVLVSLFVSFTLDPMLSAVWRDPAETRFKYAPWLGRVMTRIEHGVEKAHVVYGKLLEWALGNRKKVLALAFAIFVSSFFILPLVGTEFFPDSDEGRTSFRITTPVGSSLAYTDAKARQVEEVVRTYPEVEMMVANVGTWEGRNVARVDVRLSEKTSARTCRSRISRRRCATRSARSRGSSSRWATTARSGSTCWDPRPKARGPHQRDPREDGEDQGHHRPRVEPEGAEPRDHDEGEQRARERPGPHRVADRRGRAPVRRGRRDQPLARARRAELRRERAVAEIGPAHRFRPGRALRHQRAHQCRRHTDADPAAPGGGIQEFHQPADHQAPGAATARGPLRGTSKGAPPATWAMTCRRC
jgi:multidrug efflux pump subunit AcrB